MTEQNIIRIKKIDKKAVLPTKAHANDACYDIRVLVDRNRNMPQEVHGNEVVLTADKDGSYSAFLQPCQRIVFKTGIAIQPPKGYSTRVHVRSSVGIKKGVNLSNTVAVIDENYRGELLICLRNIGKNLVLIKDGERVAQLELVKDIPSVIWEVNELDETERGENGIGSSGVN